MQNNTCDSGDWQTVLRTEFEGREGSFLLQISCGPGWDKEAYLRLFNAMLACCKAHDGQTHIERWIAEGFWYLDWFPRSQVERMENKSDYYNNAVVNFNHLAFWLFTGEGRADNEFEPL